MSVIRIHKTNNFTVMSNYHFKEKKMSLKAKGLLSLMLSLPDDWNYSISGLVTLSKDGKDSVMSALAELEEFGYLVRHRTTNAKGQFSGIEYNIYERPQLDNPIAEEQKAEKQQEDKQNAEKPPQSNTQLTNNLNNKELKKSNKNKEIDFSLYGDILKGIKDTELKQLYTDFIEHREILGAPLSKRAFGMLVDRCERISNFDAAIQKQLLETAILSGWKNIFMPKEARPPENNSRVYNREQRISSNGYDALKNFKLE